MKTMTHEELKAEAAELVATTAHAELDARVKLDRALWQATEFLEEHKAASTRDRLAHQALQEGRE